MVGADVYDGAVNFYLWSKSIMAKMLEPNTTAVASSNRYLGLLLEDELFSHNSKRSFSWFPFLLKEAPRPYVSQLTQDRPNLAKPPNGKHGIAKAPTRFWVIR